MKHLGVLVHRWKPLKDMDLEAHALECVSFESEHILSLSPQKMGGFSNRNLLFSSGNPLFSGVYFHSLYDEGQRPSLGVVLLCMAVAHFFWHFDITPLK